MGSELKVWLFLTSLRRYVVKELKFYDREYFKSLVDDEYVPRSTPDYDYAELVKDVIKELYLAVCLFSVRDVVRFIMKFTKGCADPEVLETLVCHELRYDRNR
jgi:hypothetical protein